MFDTPRRITPTLMIGVAPTPAIAICAAALRARAHKGTSNDG